MDVTTGAVVTTGVGDVTTGVVVAGTQAEVNAAKPVARSNFFMLEPLLTCPDQLVVPALPIPEQPLARQGENALRREIISIANIAHFQPPFFTHVCPCLPAEV